MSLADITKLRKLELKIKEIFNLQVFNIEVLIEITCKLSKKRSRKINELKDDRKSAPVNTSLIQNMDIN